MQKVTVPADADLVYLIYYGKRMKGFVMKDLLIGGGPVAGWSMHCCRRNTA